MKNPRQIYILAVAYILVIAAVIVYESRRPSCVDAQCINVMDSFRNSNSGRFSVCFLEEVSVGDLGGGSDESRCSLGGGSGSGDHWEFCSSTCFGFD